MIDYIRLRLDRQEYFGEFNNPERYNLKQQVNLATGEMRNLYLGDYDRMRIEINPVSIIVRGSLHKYYNYSFHNEEQNHSDFTLNQLTAAIKRLSERLKFEPEDAIIQNIEFAVNIELSCNVRSFLHNNLLMMNGDEVSQIKDYGDLGLLKRFEYANYEIKVYDKGSQYQLNKNLLRLEIKTRRSTFVTGKNKWSLNDLVRPEILNGLREKLIKQVNKLWIFDDMSNVSYENEKDEKALLEFTNPNYWKQRNSGKRNTTYYTRVDKFKDLMAKYDLDNLKKEILEKVAKKSLELIN